MIVPANVLVSDPFNITADPKMPFLAEAIDPQQVQTCLTKLLADQMGEIQLRGIQTLRYKPRRRCLIAYEVETPTQSLVLIGKVRAKGLDLASYTLQQLLWKDGFAEDSDDGISVPEPIGTILPWRMWLQRKVPGTLATDLLAGAEGTILARRIADAAHKLHQARISPLRRHTIADELYILRDRLEQVQQQYPQWEARLQRIREKCDRLGARTPEIQTCGIHRDFYGDQILVNGDRLYLLDLDLYCAGNPALDIGNFIAHMIEYSLRILGDVNALTAQEAAMEARFTSFYPEEIRPAIRSYVTLTLARHIYISTQLRDRRPFTEALLELCEQRLINVNGI